MVLKALSRALRSERTSSLVATAEGESQTIRLESAMLAHVQRHRQTLPWATESGGQLFGLVDNSVVRITRATGPYAGDERSRYRYRSNPIEAQRAIGAQFQAGLIYIGEWHTHAEDYPQASDFDFDAMSRLITRSRLNVNAMLLLIVGRANPPSGLALCLIGSDKAKRCTLSTDGDTDSQPS